MGTDGSRDLPDAVARRRVDGLDTFDEVVDGRYRMAPVARTSVLDAMVTLAVVRALGPWEAAAGLWSCGAFNLGTVHDFRVPRAGWFREPVSGSFANAVAVLLEVGAHESLDQQRLAFFASHRVQEILMADPATRTITCVRLESGRYQHSNRSSVINADVVDLIRAIRWPTAGNAPSSS